MVHSQEIQIDARGTADGYNCRKRAPEHNVQANFSMFWTSCPSGASAAVE